MNSKKFMKEINVYLEKNKREKKYTLLEKDICYTQ